jgi:hypothetical protein
MDAFQHFHISLQESGVSEPLSGPLRLRVGKGYPYLLHFAGAKALIQQIDPGTKEGNVAHLHLKRIPGAFPHPGALDVDPYEVLAGVVRGQARGIFPFTATEFQNNRIVVAENFSAPLALQRKSIGDLGVGWLEKMRESGIFCKSSEFLLGHLTF